MKTSIVTQIHNGNLGMPNIPQLRKSTHKTTYREIEKMFSAMWHMYINKGVSTPISLPYWAKRIANPKAMNIALKVLSDNNWIQCRTIPSNNWSEAYLSETKLLTYVSQELLDSVRTHYKFSNYKLRFDEPSTEASNTRVQGKVLQTGITAHGFKKEGNTQFQFDTNRMSQYRDETIALVNKGIEKTIAQYPELANDHANYGEVAKTIVDNYIINDDTYTSGPRTSDPRGRNNSGYLNKVGNPVGYKIMRSMLVIPEQFRNIATDKGAEAIYLFIAELQGFKKGTKAQKWLNGIKLYTNKTFIKADLKDLFENVWLERLYDELDAYYTNKGAHKWSTPIEIDVSASVLAIIGILLNHKPFMERCNMIGDTLGDAWAHDVITNRKQFKTIMRQVYGSTLTPQQMWNAMDIPYTPEEAKAFTHELHNGDLAVANAFKDFIMNNANPQPEMTVKIWDRNIKTHCNKFHNVGELTTQFDLYDSYTGRIRRINHTDTKKVFDLKSFRRYFPTKIIHGIDGNVADKTVNKVYDKYNWVLSVHDALLLCPEAADFARATYASYLEEVYEQRNTILSNFFRSIGVPATAIVEWKETVAKLVEPLEEPFKCNKMTLK